MRELKEKINELNIKSQKLRTLSKTEKLFYAKTKKIQSEQSKIYDKFIFFKSLYKELERNDKNEWN